MLFTNGETLLLDPRASRWSSCSSSRGCTCCPPAPATRSTSWCPGILALAVMSTAMTALGIGTGFERGYGVLKRLGSTPLGRPRLLGRQDRRRSSRVELVQAAVLVAVGLAPRLEPRRAGRGGRPGRCGASWPWCSARSPSAGSGCCWPGRSSRWSTWPSSTASSWCCCCSAACSSRSAKLPGLAGRHRQGAAGLGAGRRAARDARARRAGVGPRLGRAGGLGGRRARGRRAHLPLGVSRMPGWRSRLSAAVSRSAGAASWSSSALVDRARSRGRPPGPRQSMKKVLRLPVQPVEAGGHLQVWRRPRPDR